MVFDSDVMNSIGEIVMGVYLIMAMPYVSNLMSNHLKNELSTNRYLQHGLLCLMIIILIKFILRRKEKNDLVKTVVIGLLVYVIIIFTTKMNYKYNILFVILLVFYVFYENDINVENDEIMNDVLLEEGKKKNLVSANNKKKGYLTFGMFIVGALGFVFYFMEKNTKFSGGGTFDEVEYFLN